MVERHQYSALLLRNRRYFGADTGDGTESADAWPSTWVVPFGGAGSKAFEAVGWQPRDDGAFLLGLWRHGFGEYNDVREDADLELEAKIRPTGQDGGAEEYKGRPGRDALNGRLLSLLQRLREEEEDAAARAEGREAPSVLRRQEQERLGAQKAEQKKAKAAARQTKKPQRKKQVAMPQAELKVKCKELLKPLEDTLHKFCEVRSPKTKLEPAKAKKKLAKYLGEIGQRLVATAAAQDASPVTKVDSKRATSSFMLFSSEFRPAVKAELEGAGVEGAQKVKVGEELLEGSGVAQIAKVLGARWKTLDETEAGRAKKAAYEATSAVEKASIAAQKAAVESGAAAAPTEVVLERAIWKPGMWTEGLWEAAYVVMAEYHKSRKLPGGQKIPGATQSDQFGKRGAGFKGFHDAYTKMEKAKKAAAATAAAAAGRGGGGAEGCGGGEGGAVGSAAAAAAAGRSSPAPTPAPKPELTPEQAMQKALMKKRKGGGGMGGGGGGGGGGGYSNGGGGGYDNNGEPAAKHHRA